MAGRVATRSLADVAAAAARVFTQRGYRETGIADVAQELGLSHGAHYTYVQSKDALLYVALAWTIRPDLLDGLETPVRLSAEAEIFALARQWTDGEGFPKLAAALTRRQVRSAREEFGEIVDEFFDVGQSRSIPWKRRPEATRLLAAMRSADRGFDAVVIGEPQRAFYGNQYGLTFPVLVRYGVGLWVPEVGGAIEPESEAHDLVMSVFGGMSKGERNRIKIRVRAAMAAGRPTSPAAGNSPSPRPSPATASSPLQATTPPATATALAWPGPRARSGSSSPIPATPGGRSGTSSAKTRSSSTSKTSGSAMKPRCAPRRSHLAIARGCGADRSVVMQWTLPAKAAVGGLRAAGPAAAGTPPPAGRGVSTFIAGGLAAPQHAPRDPAPRTKPQSAARSARSSATSTIMSS